VAVYTGREQVVKKLEEDRRQKTEYKNAEDWSHVAVEGEISLFCLLSSVFCLLSSNLRFRIAGANITS
jgi:hypothetical protein